jgi:zinc protease
MSRLISTREYRRLVRTSIRTYSKTMVRARFSVLLLALALADVSAPRVQPTGTLAQTSDQAGQSETWRRNRPAAPPPHPFKLPAMREVKLDNGLTIVLVEDRRAPLVTIEAGIPLAPRLAGTAALASYVALSEATADLMTEGAGSLTGSELAREVESLGGRIASSANEDYAEVSAVVVSENLQRMLELFADVVLRPAFPQSEVALHKRNRIERLSVQRQEPAFLAGEMFDKVVYGSLPYALSVPTPQAVRALTRSRIDQFYRSTFSPKGSVLAVVGDFDPTQLEKTIRELFGKWSSPVLHRAVRETRISNAPRARRIYLIDRPGSEQSDFRIGGLALKRSDPDYFTLLVANAILGAGTGSRLFLNIREQKGYAYDVSSVVSALKQAGTFFGASETRTEVTVSAIKEMLAEFERIANQRVADQELQDAKSFLTGGFALSLSTQGGVADRMLGTRILGLESDYLETYRARIEQVTADQIRQAARKYISTVSPAIVVVGDARKLAKELRAIAPVLLFNTEGRRLPLKL